MLQRSKRFLYHSAQSGRESSRTRIFVVYKTNWIGRKVHGDRALCLIKVFVNNYRQKCMSSRMLFFVLAVTSQEYRELYDIAGGPVLFEWKCSPGHTTMQLLQVVQTTMKNESEVHPRDFKGRASCSCQCTTTSTGPRRTMKINADKIHYVNPHMPKILLHGAGHFSALEIKREVVGDSLLQT